MFRHQFLSFCRGCACAGRSPFAQGCRELRFGVRMCLPELITPVFYTLPYLQLQREQLRHLGCFQRPLPAGLSPGPTRGCFCCYLQVVSRVESLCFQMSAASLNIFKCSLPAGFSLAGFAAAAPWIPAPSLGWISSTPWSWESPLKDPSRAQFIPLLLK